MYLCSLYILRKHIYREVPLTLGMDPITSELYQAAYSPTADSRGPKFDSSLMGGSRGGQGVQTPPTPHEKSPKIGFLYITENHKAAKSAFKGGPLSARQQNAISMPFCWQADNCLLLVVFGASLPPPPQKKKKKKKKLFRVGPPLTKLSGSTHEPGPILLWRLIMK